ncbi:MAG: acetolactate synthase, large subunit, biosynthetic type [Pelagibacterales bacterium]|nr:acetolactate synthase, large subunit, biosynthetic type [Pelagibacterales bacterium]PPR16172.1 MAG: Acetolactate synthase isozyme 3 large subunit [Alphaproteobacteria bacterium MarineAlpha9_Bin3]|tara:strand:- start:2017 stop:3765 length:1749 start_codon:yes stop_codon:yes gene_type:complete
MKLSGSEIIIKTLADLNVEVIFGYPGGAVLPIYDAIFKQNRIRHVLVRHEQAAVHMAEGYARSTGKVGVILVTSGPGATNAVTGLTDALMDSIPLLCLTGQVPTHLIGTDAFQEADTIGITASCTKHNYLVKDINDLESTIAEGFYVARSGRPGPVVIDLPKDVQNAVSNYKEIKVKSMISYKPAKKAKISNVKQAVDILLKSKKPIIYSGGGVINSGVKASNILTKLVNYLNIPITQTLMGLGAVSAKNKKFLGMLGMHGTYEANMAMHDCDVMLCVGARFDDRITGNLKYFSPNSKKIHIDIDPSSINKNVKVDIPLIGDCYYVLDMLFKELKQNKSKLNSKSIDKWWNKINKWKKKDCLSFKDSKETIKPQKALKVLNDALKGKDAFITTEVGQHQMWAAQYLDFYKPNRWMTSGGLGTMGYGFPAAIGVQIAHPKKPVICVAGEASFLMNMQELSSLRQLNIPVKIFILNNEYMGMVRQWQEFFHGGRYAESYTDSLPDFISLANSFGIKGIRVTDPKELNKSIKEMLDHKGPVLMDVCVAKMENVFPMIPAGAAHNEMKLSDKDDKETQTAEGLALL